MPPPPLGVLLLPFLESSSHLFMLAIFPGPAFEMVISVLIVQLMTGTF